jgi:hypothetical protein
MTLKQAMNQDMVILEGVSDSEFAGDIDKHYCVRVFPLFIFSPSYCMGI